VVGGTYRCDGGCTFDGTVDYGQPRNFSLDVPIFDGTGRATIYGSVSVDLTTRSTNSWSVQRADGTYIPT
jgi:hypothetical protein